MKKIKSLSIENLKLAEEMSYYHFVIEAVELHKTIAEKSAKSFAMFKAAYDHQNTLYLRHDRKILTQAVQAKEATRDKWVRKLRNNVREVVEFGDGEKREAAEFISAIIEEYGGAKIPDMPVESETGVLLNLYEDLQDKYSSKLEQLGLTSVVEGAKLANDEFIAAQNRRTQSDADYGKGAMDEARPVTLRKYRYFIDSINVEAEVDDEGALTSFIDYMNAKIGEMRRLTGQNISSSSTTDDEDAVVEKTATFKPINGDIQKIKLEVGAPLVAPENTPGYHWKPEVPETMPSKNTTYKEVENKKVKLTFHYLNHTEVIVEGPIGAALETPMNTVGCHWEPKVPKTFPDEDKKYVEALSILDGPDDKWEGVLG